MKNNKGFSLVELVIVVAIIALLAGLSMLSFNAANSQKPAKARSNLMNSAEYSKTLVRSEEKDCCVALIKSADNNNYYCIQGTATGDSQDELKNSFRSLNSVKSTVTMPLTSEEKDVKRNDPSGGFSLSELISDPKKAQDYQSVGDGVRIYYEGTEITSNINTAVIIKFRKHDGKALFGSGKYEFYKRKASSVDCSVELEESTGAFHE